MPFPPQPQPVAKDLEEAVDALAYILATTDGTTNISWIIGDVGMGPPLDAADVELPFGYISVLDEQISWETARGGTGSGGPQGIDDWRIPVVLTVAFAPHQFVAPIPAQPPAASPFNAANLTIPPPYHEQPGWRQAQELTQSIKGVLRLSPVLGGEVASTRITESKFVRLGIQGQMYRAVRVQVALQQRRKRGT